ncbi:unnamed protein product, partial [Hymenolepis diminuta]
YEKTIEKCRKVFGDNTSLFNRHYKCLNLVIHEGEDVHNYTAIVVIVPFYIEIGLKLLPGLDGNPDVMLHNLLRNLRSFISDSNVVESNKTRTC